MCVFVYFQRGMVKEFVFVFIKAEELLKEAYTVYVIIDYISFSSKFRNEVITLSSTSQYLLLPLYEEFGIVLFSKNKR